MLKDMRSRIFLGEGGGVGVVNVIFRSTDLTGFFLFDAVPYNFNIYYDWQLL